MAPVILVTRELLRQGRGQGGWDGYTREQLRLLGVVEWPPPRGWKSGVLGRFLSALAAEAFLELKDPGQRELFGT